jgi:hypothetical protein
MAWTTFDCPHCDAKNIRFILSGLVLVKKFTSRTPQDLLDKKAGLFSGGGICSARKCMSPVAFRLSMTEGGVLNALNEGDVYSTDRELIWDVVDSWPKKAGPSIPANLPDQAHRAMDEAEKARLGHIYGLAISGYRRALDIATRSFDPENAPAKGHYWLVTRLTHLQQSGRLTDDLVQWCKDICDREGQETHGGRPATQKEADEWATLTQMVLVYLFTLPQRIRIARMAGVDKRQDQLMSASETRT